MKDTCQMFSKILIKLIDESIIPAILLLVTRLVTVVLVARANSIPFEIGVNGFVFKSPDDYILVNSYSLFFMIAVVTVGLFYVLTKSLLFHESHIKPGISTKLQDFNLRHMIQNSFNLYTQGSIWLSYCYLLMLVAGFMALFKFIFPWVFYVALVLSVISTILLIIDIEEELHIMKKKNPEYDNEEVAINLDDLEDDE